MTGGPVGYRVTILTPGKPDTVPLTRDYPAADDATVTDGWLFLLPLSVEDDSDADSAGDPDAQPVAIFPPGCYGPVERIDLLNAQQGDSDTPRRV